MPVLPAWAVTAFWQYGVPVIIAALRKLGAIGAAEAWEAKAAARVIRLAESVKVYNDPDADPALYPKPKGRDSM